MSYTIHSANDKDYYFLDNIILIETDFNHSIKPQLSSEWLCCTVSLKSVKTYMNKGIFQSNQFLPKQSFKFAYHPEFFAHFKAQDEKRDFQLFIDLIIVDFFDYSDWKTTGYLIQKI